MSTLPPQVRAAACVQGGCFGSHGGYVWGAVSAMWEGTAPARCAAAWLHVRCSCLLLCMFAIAQTGAHTRLSVHALPQRTLQVASGQQQLLRVQVWCVLHQLAHHHGDGVG
jgi:hypothetical protein